MDLDIFKSKYNDFVSEFDEIIANDGYDCENLYNLVSQFLASYKSKYMDKIEFGSAKESSFPECSSTQTCDEDLLLLDKNNLFREVSPSISEEAKICADIYRRAARALYSLTTLEKLRNNLDKHQERYEALQFARYSLRYNSKDSSAICFYSLSELPAIFLNKLSIDCKQIPSNWSSTNPFLID